MRLVRIDSRSLLLGVALAIVGWIFLSFLTATLPVLLVLLAGLVLAATLGPLVTILRKPSFPPSGWRIPTSVAVLLIYLAGGAIVIGMLYWISVRILQETSRFRDILATLVASPDASVDVLVRRLGLPAALQSMLAGVLRQTGSVSNVQFATVLGVLGSPLTVIVYAFIALSFAFFLVVDAEAILRFWLRLFPPAQRDQARALIVHISHNVGTWLLGRLAVSTSVGILCGITLLVFNLPLPIVIAVITGILDVVPLVGPTVMIPLVFGLGLLQSPLVATLVAVVFFAIGQLDAVVLTPLVMGRAVRLPPIVIVAVIPLGAAVYGVLGALLAIPAATALAVVVDEVILPWLDERERA